KIRNNVINDNGANCKLKGTLQSAVFISSTNSTEVNNNNIRVPGGGAMGIMIQNDPRGDAKVTANDTIHDNIVTFKTAGGAEGWFNDGGPSGSGNFSNTNKFFVVGTGDSHWVWNGNLSPLSWSSYRSQTGQDAASTLTTGDASVAGCASMDCTGNPVTGAASSTCSGSSSSSSSSSGGVVATSSSGSTSGSSSGTVTGSSSS